MKFGGTSVADPDAINRLIDIVKQRIPSSKAPAPVVVVSALSGVTDSLVDVTRLAEDGEGDRAAAVLKTLLERHVAVATAVTNGGRAALVAAVRREFGELMGLVHALAVIREMSPRSTDAVLAAGEV